MLSPPLAQDPQNLPQTLQQEPGSLGNIGSPGASTSHGGSLGGYQRIPSIGSGNTHPQQGVRPGFNPGTTFVNLSTFVVMSAQTDVNYRLESMRC